MKRRRPLTAKVVRGLNDIIPAVRVELDSGEEGCFADAQGGSGDFSAVESALAWIESQASAWEARHPDAS